MSYYAMILNVTRAEQAAGDASCIGAGAAGVRLRSEDRPSYVHLDREAAERELLRLALAYPRDEFVLLEMTARAEVIDGPMTAREQWAAARGLGRPDKVARLVATMEGRGDV